MSKIAKKMKHVGWTITEDGFPDLDFAARTRADAIEYWETAPGTSVCPARGIGKYQMYHKMGLAKAVKLYVEVPDGK